MEKNLPISSKLPVFMHGADYNPDQWLHDPEIFKEDIRLMKLAHCTRRCESPTQLAWCSAQSLLQLPSISR